MRTIVGVVGTEDVLETMDAAGLPGVAETMRITAPYKLVSAQNHTKRTTIRVGGVPIGPDTFTFIAGPCAVETAEQTLEAALMAKRAGATLLRGGAYKPRTSPYAFQGLGVAGLRILAEVSAEVGLPFVTEVMDVSEVDVVAEHADMLQIGTRNMQNFGLLQAVGSTGKPVMLKRGLTATYEEWLMAAEYIAQRGNLDIVLCERGVRSFEPAIRNMLDVSAVAMVSRLSHLPVIVDPSHAAGRRDLVVPLARAGIAAGADGIMVDVHPHPEMALVDGAQALVRRRPRRTRRGGRDPPAATGPDLRRAPGRLTGRLLGRRLPLPRLRRVARRRAAGRLVATGRLVTAGRLVPAGLLVTAGLLIPAGLLVTAGRLVTARRRPAAVSAVGPRRGQFLVVPAALHQPDDQQDDRGDEQQDAGDEQRRTDRECPSRWTCRTRCRRRARTASPPAGRPCTGPTRSA